MFQEFQAAGGDEEDEAKQKAELDRRREGEADEAPSDDRHEAATHPRPQGQSLCQANQQCLTVGNLVEADSAVVSGDVVAVQPAGGTEQ